MNDVGVASLLIPPGFEPMRAGKVKDPEALNYPVGVTPKYDGLRAVVWGGMVWSNNLKPIPNLHVQKMFGLKKYEGNDGELVVGPHDEKVFNRTQSACMSVEGKPDVSFVVFDNARNPEEPHHMRRQRIATGKGIALAPTRLAHSVDELLAMEHYWLGAGMEGVMVRDEAAPYKYGRSTTKQGYLLKLKQFEDAECEVLGVGEENANTNAKTLESTGKAKRSSHKAGKVGKGTLGFLKVRGINGKFAGVEFDLGTGFSAKQRAELFKRDLTGLIVTYKYFPKGSKDKPRHPVFKAFRAALDMAK